MHSNETRVMNCNGHCDLPISSFERALLQIFPADDTDDNGSSSSVKSSKDAFEELQNLVNNSSCEDYMLSMIKKTYSRFVRQQLKIVVEANSILSKDQNSMFKRNVKLMNLLINQEDHTNSSLKVSCDWAQVTTNELFKWLQGNDQSVTHDDPAGLCSKLKVMVGMIKNRIYS